MEEEKPEEERNSMYHRELAGAKFKASKFKSAYKHAKKAQSLSPNLDGISSMITAFKILRESAKSRGNSGSEWYSILQVEPFSHINIVKKQYKRLALVLHPDKNPYLGCEDAFKLVSEGFRVLSDTVTRNEYDTKLRLRIQSERIGGGGEEEEETFWTACSRCSLLHQFERKYLGFHLVCPNCEISFKAVEVKEENQEDVDDSKNWSSRLRNRADLKKPRAIDDVDESIVNLKTRDKSGSISSKRKLVGGDERVAEDTMTLAEMHDLDERIVNLKSRDKSGSISLKRKLVGGDERVAEDAMTLAEMHDLDERIVNLKSRDKSGMTGRITSKRKLVGGDERVTDDTMILAEMHDRDERILNLKSRDKMGNISLKEKLVGCDDRVADDTMTLAEMHDQDEGIVNLKSKDKAGNISSKKKLVGCDERVAENTMTLAEMQLEVKLKNNKKKNMGENEKDKSACRMYRDSKKIEYTTTATRRTLKKSARESERDHSDLDIIEVEDSDFYDFDKDRIERSFKKGQVWAIYDDDDGMPRNYALIDKVVSVYPFEMILSWLDLQSIEDDDLSSLAKMGFHLSCGRFKVSRTTITNHVNIFSHLMDCERAAREIYRVYPKKGSIWAVYSDSSLEKGRYEIIVSLTTFSEMHGLSMAYLEKVEGYKSIFKRREVGAHAIRWLEKDEIQVFSHQVPSRKLQGDKVPDDLKDCWELDPASLPSGTISIAGHKQ